MKLALALLAIGIAVVLVKCEPQRGAFRNYFSFNEDRLASPPPVSSDDRQSSASRRNQQLAELMDICLTEPGCSWECEPGSEDDCQCACKRRQPSESCAREPGCHWVCAADGNKDCKCVCKRLTSG